MSPPLIRRLYPRAHEGRLPINHPELKAIRPKFFKAAILNLCLYILLFFCLFCYLYGSLFQQGPRTHNLHILFVDYDGGVIGDAVRNAYSSLQSHEFPSMIERSVSQFPTQADLREAVCHAHYWAALFTSPGASTRLGLAIAGLNTTQYNPSDVLSFIWNEAKYSAVMDSLVASNLHTLSDTAKASYIALNGTSAFPTIPSSNNAAAISAFTNPWTLTSINIMPTTQGTRTVYNTITIVLALIEDFFYLATINGLYASFKVYTRISPLRIVLVRDAISITFTMLGSLLNSAAIWAFKANWHVSAGQYAITWLILWLFAHVNFLAFDVFTIWLPPQYVSMALVTDNWSHGCNPHLSYALPVLFSYEVVGLILTGIGVYKRCHYAVILEETTKEAMRLRVEAVLKLEREHDILAQREKSETSSGEVSPGGPSRATTADMLGQLDQASREQRRQVETGLQQLDNEIERMGTRASRASNIGPAFCLIGSREE